MTETPRLRPARSLEIVPESSSVATTDVVVVVDDVPAPVVVDG
jgi:hypothetical protein